MASASQTSLRTKVQFLFTKHQSSTYARMSVNIARVVCAYLSMDRFLAAVDGAALWVFDLALQTKQRIPLLYEFAGGVSQCLCDEYHLLVVGGFRRKKATCRVHFTSATVLAEADMLNERVCPGIIRFDSYVWVFGGINKLRTSEKFHILEKNWTHLPDMSTPKALFTPCEWHEEIYLPDANDLSSPLEVFTPATEEYRHLSLLLPERSNELVSFIVDGELIMLTPWQTLGVWRVESSDSEVKVTKAAFSLESSAMAVMLPERRGLFMYWVSSAYQLVSFDLRTKTLREE